MKVFFENIDNELNAYWLGFIYADGNIQFNEKSRNYELSIELQEQDGELLVELSKVFGSVHDVQFRSRTKTMNGYTFNSKTAFLRIYSKTICSDLISQNIKPNKTYLLEHPTVEDEYMFFHFLRGFMDGDGCIYNNTLGSLQLSFTNSNNVFLKYLNNKIESILNITGGIYKETENKYKLMFFRKKETSLLLSYIYRDSHTARLNRKYEIYNKSIGSPV